MQGITKDDYVTSNYKLTIIKRPCKPYKEFYGLKP